MATLLEQAIAAAKQGRKAEAKTLFEQVLQADDKNERAWLWLSEVATSNFERIAYVERALAINPDNVTTQLALQKLKAQNGQPTSAIVPVSRQKTTGLLKSQPRKPFRLTDEATVINGTATHRQATIAMDPITQQNALRQAAASGSATKTFAAGPAPVDIHQAYDLENMPLFPLIVFGALSLTAVGGIFMLIILGIMS